MRTDDLEPGASDPSQDNFTQQRLGDTRRPKITLVHLNRLKKMRAARDLENLVRRDLLDMLYGAPDEGSPMGM